MSPQTVAIDTLRHVREGEHNEHKHVVAHVAPTVAAQMEFWYEDEVLELSKELDAKIHVRIDPMLHPERFRINRSGAFKDQGIVRVGDEHEVELLGGRLPNATSAAAVVDGHIVEVENAANNAGNSAKIRIIDVDAEDDYVLAELVTAGAAAAAKKKRRRGGRGRRGELTAAEEAAQLRELAEEAASSQQARPPIGITTLTEEEEASDKAIAAEAKGESLPDAIVIGEEELDHREGETGKKKRRRRRRRGGRGRGGEQRSDATNVGISPQSAVAQGAQFSEEDDEYEDDEAQPPLAAQAHPNGQSQAPGQGSGRRRRRRRRGGRGRGGEGGQPPFTPQQGGLPHAEPLTGSLPMSPSVPDRHVFRVGSDGKAQPTGRTAPREPSRAIAPLRSGAPAVEPPPPRDREGGCRRAGNDDDAGVAAGRAGENLDPCRA